MLCNFSLDVIVMWTLNNVEMPCCKLFKVQFITLMDFKSIFQFHCINIIGTTALFRSLKYRYLSTNYISYMFFKVQVFRRAVIRTPQ